MSTVRPSTSTRKAVRQDGAEKFSAPRASHLIETYLQQRILSGEWPSDFKLPSEAGLRQQFGASRTAVREAIRRLQGRGLLKTINGSGSYVAGGRLENVSQALNDYSVLVAGDKTFGDLLELRMAIEGDAAAKVAGNRSSDDWQRLEGRLAAMDACRLMEEFAILDIEFHMEMLRLSGNELFVSLGTALRDRYVRFAIDSYREGDRLRTDTMKEHRQIVQAVMSGNPAAAREAARQHVCQARGRWESVHEGEPQHDVGTVEVK
jgi:GntR family transcriptional regulator, transcriptional repressor for pyruvate dehydrogenase complex